MIINNYIVLSQLFSSTKTSLKRHITSYQAKHQRMLSRHLAYLFLDLFPQASDHSVKALKSGS